ncbi:MAG TPA: glucose dehydrogenase [Anaerolineaceae bacterium]|jgi:glucose 1-dehydrogenase|nr:MAG: Glucose dehydrogenase [Anaerolineaceae bacterium 46_22]HAF48448.1 glucose dehydrogenase [Anaerolineaceae bacterium]
MDLKHKTALVTGGGVRLGRAFALALAKEGANLVIHYNSSQEPAEETAQLARESGVEAITIGANFNHSDAVNNIFPQIHNHFNCVDILINNAALYLRGSGLETNREIWEKQFRVNLKTPFFLIQAFAKQLPSDRQGRVLNIADAQIIQNKPDHFAYRLTKLALVEMTRMFAIELAPRITVNALGLGIMLPLAGKEDVDLEAYANKYVLLQRTGSPDIAAENAIHLIKSDFTTGAFLRVDGGQYL